MQKGTDSLSIGVQFHDGSLLPDSFLDVCVVRDTPEGLDLDVQRLLGGALWRLEYHLPFVSGSNRIDEELKFPIDHVHTRGLS